MNAVSELSVTESSQPTNSQDRICLTIRGCQERCYGTNATFSELLYGAIFDDRPTTNQTDLFHRFIFGWLCQCSLYWHICFLESHFFSVTGKECTTTPNTPRVRSCCENIPALLELQLHSWWTSCKRMSTVSRFCFAYIAKNDAVGPHGWKTLFESLDSLSRLTKTTIFTNQSQTDKWTSELKAILLARTGRSLGSLTTCFFSNCCGYEYSNNTVSWKLVHFVSWTECFSPVTMCCTWNPDSIKDQSPHSSDWLLSFRDFQTSPEQDWPWSSPRWMRLWKSAQIFKYQLPHSKYVMIHGLLLSSLNP